MMRFARHPPSRASVACATSAIVGLFAMASLPAAAEIFKCTDPSGNVTYQNEKCPAGTKAGRVEIFDNNWTASRSEKEAEWQRNAAEHRVLTGMPARWVREALGDPTETRETTTGGAKELWLYNLPDRSVQVGMLDNQALWVRETPVVAPAARVAPTPSSTAGQSTGAPAPRAIDILNAPESSRPAEAPRASAPRREGQTAPRVVELPRVAEAPRAPEARRNVTRGRDCREVIAELGTPDRQREIPASDAAGTDAMTEYVYESTGSAGRTRILCANGKVEGVDRSVAR
jgi:hypothetical protein